MAGSFNKVILLGNLVRDPELRYTPQGTAVTDITLAISDTRSKNAQEQSATFVDVTIWERSAEVICEYMRKGKPLLIEGRLVTDSWEDRETGKRRTRLKVVAQSFQFVDSRAGGEGEYSGGGGGGSNASDGGYRSSGGARGGNKPASGRNAPSSAGSFDVGGFPSDDSLDDIPF